MIDKRPRIIDVERKPQKCPVCGERVVDIIYGTGDMTESLLFEKEQKVFFRNPPSPLPKGAPPLPTAPLLRRGAN